MPSPNLEKVYLEETFYHIYNRGVNKRKIFLEDKDYAVFLNLLKRYLDAKPAKDRKGREYAWLHEDLELLAYCLMPNHFHLFVFQHTADAMTKLLRAVSTSYSSYFNKKYRRSGHLFQDRFKASMITNEAYLVHVSRYIHLNPDGYRSYKWSSLPYYLKEKSASWVVPKRILDLFQLDDYEAFVSDYEGQKQIMASMKAELADH